MRFTRIAFASLFTTAIAIGLFVQARPIPAGGTVYGDVNCSGEVDSVDAALVLQLSAALVSSLTCEENADVNGDGSVSAIDAALILQFSAGILHELGPPSIGALAVAAGDEHTCALTATGGVQCWGRNRFGQLGDGTRTDRVVPVDVSGLTSNVMAITTGDDHACALTDAGAVGCWGDNDSGELGDGTTIERTYPVAVVGLETGITAIASRSEHTCGLTEGGGLKCWGMNWYGQLGDGTSGVGNDSNTPVDVLGLGGGVAALATGGSHTCALMTSGTVKCWGRNSYGQLGDGTRNDRVEPQDVLGLTGVVAITAGYVHTCALTAGGDVKCWGYNMSGQLGAPSTESCGEQDGVPVLCSTTPAGVNGSTSGYSAVAAGAGHTCAITTAGSLQCWGANDFGQVGDGTGTLTEDRTEPAQVLGLDSGVVEVAPGVWHTCAVTAAGQAKCWGYNSYGQLGDGTEDQRLAPVDVIGF